MIIIKLYNYSNSNIVVIYTFEILGCPGTLFIHYFVILIIKFLFSLNFYRIARESFKQKLGEE